MDQDFGHDVMRGTEATAAMRAAGCASLIVGLTGDSHEGHDASARAAGQPVERFTAEHHADLHNESAAMLHSFSRTAWSSLSLSCSAIDLP